jgi:hypothetical protein
MRYIFVFLFCILILTGCSNNISKIYENKTEQINNTIIVSNQNINVVKINIDTINVKEGLVVINETITNNDNLILDAECELDIVNNVGDKIINYRSFYNDNGNMIFNWENANKGEYILSQYCWHGETLDLNKIYKNSTIIVV